MDQSAPKIIDAQSERNKLIYWSQLHGFQWFILSLSTLLMIVAWYIATEQVNKRVSERFERESLQVIELVKERMQLYEHALWGAVAHVDASEESITDTQWRNYSNSLRIDETYPGINGLGLIYNIKPEQLNLFTQQHKITRANFKLHPTHEANEYWPITFIEPLLPNQQAVGLDMAFEANRYSGVKKARDTGLAQLTGPITLIQDSKKTPGFLFFAPFYQKNSPHDTIKTRRQSIEGVAYAPFIMHKLISGTLAFDKRHVTLSISDNGNTLYNDVETIDVNQIDPNPLFTEDKNVNFYGREWNFTISSNLAFRTTSASNQPYIILGGGLLINFLLFALFIVLSRANKQAIKYADDITRELKINTQRLVKSNQDLEQFAYVASHDLKSPLNAIQKLVNWITEDCEEILPDSSKEHLALLKSRSGRMNKLLDDLLDYARIGRNEYKPQAFDLAVTAQAIFSLLDHPEGFSLSVEKQILLLPKTPLEIVLRNLISNAIKHHDKAIGHISITYKKIENMHKIYVQDDGPGIPNELFEKALEMFQTLRPRDKVEGSGMGLSLSKKTIEHYGGNLMIESDGVSGTTIIIMWPISLEQQH